MAKRGKTIFGTMLVLLLLAISVAGCDNIGKTGKKDKEVEFVRGPEGLVMEFVPNYPQDKFIVSKPKQAGEGEPISVLIEVRNKGTYPTEGLDLGIYKEFLVKYTSSDPGWLERTIKSYGSLEQLKESGTYASEYSDFLKIAGIKDTKIFVFGLGALHLSGFDTSIIQMEKDSNGKQKLSQRLGEDDGTPILYLPAASSVNPLGGVDTAEFDGRIIADNILIDSYNPTILVTACYPYFTKSTPTVCIDPEPFDTRQEKVCNIGSQTVPNQGAPIAVTKIEQEAAAGKIQFKITIRNVGKGDVIWDKDGVSKLVPLLSRCNPNEGGRLGRKDFDRVQLEKVKIGDVDLFDNRKCAPFADGTNNIVRLFEGEGFVICTYDVPDTVQSAYTTPIDIELRYAYRSTISKPIQIKKLETVGG